MKEKNNRERRVRFRFKSKLSDIDKESWASYLVGITLDSFLNSKPKWA